MSELYSVIVRDIQELGPNVKQFRVDRPANYNFVPGQATQVTIDNPDWRDQTHPYSFTSLRADSNLEFILKIPPDGDELTRKLDELNVSEGMVIGEPEDAIQYTGPGVFIANGVGITSFIGILRQLREDDELESNRLMLFNESAEDVILEDEFEAMLGSDFLNILPKEHENEKYITGSYGPDFLRKYVTENERYVYICGPPEFVEAIQNYLEDLGVEYSSLAYRE